MTRIARDRQKSGGDEWAGLLKVSVATMSGIIDRLVEHGVVLRTEDPADRRVRRLTVTSEGSEMIRGLLSTTGTIPVPVLDRMSVHDLRALVQGLGAIDQAARELQNERGS